MAPQPSRPPSRPAPDVDAAEAAAPARRSSPLVAPMPGTVIRVLVEAGAVAARQPLVVIEAMKMETPLVSPYAATVRRSTSRRATASPAARCSSSSTSRRGGSTASRPGPAAAARRRGAPQPHARCRGHVRDTPERVPSRRLWLVRRARRGRRRAMQTPPYGLILAPPRRRPRSRRSPRRSTRSCRASSARIRRWRSSSSSGQKRPSARALPGHLRARAGRAAARRARASRDAATGRHRARSALVHRVRRRGAARGRAGRRARERRRAPALVPDGGILLWEDGGEAVSLGG